MRRLIHGPKVTFICLLLIGIWGIAAASAQKENPVIAVADGFTLTQKDISGFKQIVEKSNFHSTYEHYRDAAVRTWLFAEEAKHLGLGADTQTQSVDMIQQRMELSILYIKKVLDEYPLGETVIESYYRSHPEYPQPLDAELRDRIRGNILAGKRLEILTAEADRLKEKYNLRMINPSTGAPE